MNNLGEISSRNQVRHAASLFCCCQETMDLLPSSSAIPRGRTATPSEHIRGLGLQAGAWYIEIQYEPVPTLFSNTCEPPRRVCPWIDNKAQYIARSHCRIKCITRSAKVPDPVESNTCAATPHGPPPGGMDLGLQPGSSPYCGAGIQQLGVECEISCSSAVMSLATSAKSGVLRYRSPVSGSMHRMVEPFGAVAAT